MALSTSTFPSSVRTPPATPDYERNGQTLSSRPGRVRAKAGGARGCRWEALNESIHSHLSEFIFEFKSCNQRCHYWLQKEFGADGRSDIVKLREGIEARLGSFRQVAAARERRERRREKTVGSRASNPIVDANEKTGLSA